VEQEDGDALCFSFAHPGVQGQVGG
jgi:hypothetical protein